jgi:DNA topoisomerase IA
MTPGISRAATLPFASETEAQQVAADLAGATLQVVDRHEEVITEFPPPAYTTATLLEDAMLAFGWTISQVTNVAQVLFEKGLITYPRTDSVRVAGEAVEAGKQMVVALYGKGALGQAVGELTMRETAFLPHRLSQQSDADSEGEAHEAIRPTSPDRHPDAMREIDPDLCRLYRLIWARFLASLMKPATYRVITVTLESEP